MDRVFEDVRTNKLN